MNEIDEIKSEFSRAELILNDINLRVAIDEDKAKRLVEKARHKKNFFANQTTFCGDSKRIKGTQFPLLAEMVEIREEMFHGVSLPPYLKAVSTVNRKNPVNLMIGHGLNSHVEGMPVHRHLSVWLDEVISETSSVDFCRLMSNIRNNCSRRARKMKDEIERSIESYGRVLVVRLDLFYQDNGRSISRISPDIEKLRRNMLHNKSLSKGFIKAFVKLEFGISKGAHAHLILLYDGNQRWRDDVIGDRVGEYWADVVTRGDGAFYNTNRYSVKSRLSRRIGVSMDCLAVGMHRKGDNKKQNNLITLVSYLAKEEQRLIAGFGERFRSFRVFSNSSMR